MPRFADPTISVSHDELIMQNPQMTPREIASPHATVVCAKYSPSSPEAPAANTNGLQRQAVRFAACMRAHHVATYPDPSADGTFKLGPEINPKAPAFTTAVRACRKLAPATLQLRSS